jgi:hypothetical protein
MVTLSVLTLNLVTLNLVDAAYGLQAECSLACSGCLPSPAPSSNRLIPSDRRMLQALRATKISIVFAASDTMRISA